MHCHRVVRPRERDEQAEYFVAHIRCMTAFRLMSSIVVDSRLAAQNSLEHGMEAMLGLRL